MEAVGSSEKSRSMFTLASSSSSWSSNRTGFLLVRRGLLPDRGVGSGLSDGMADEDWEGSGLDGAPGATTALLLGDAVDGDNSAMSRGFGPSLINWLDHSARDASSLTTGLSAGKQMESPKSIISFAVDDVSTKFSSS